MKVLVLNGKLYNT